MADIKIEQRTIATELRAVGDFALAGLAACYGTNSRNLGGFVEQIKRGAFSRSLRSNPDVYCLFNHDPNNVLGRTKSGSLTLTDSDDEGLLFYCQLIKGNAQHESIYAMIKRGDVSQCSFAFKLAKNGDKFEGTAKDENGKSVSLRTLLDVDLVDVSAVTYPAYFGTNVDARNRSANRGGDYMRSAAEQIALRNKLDNLVVDSELRQRLAVANRIMRKG